MSKSTSVIPIIGSVKNYEWGKNGLDSLVSKMSLKNGIITEIDNDKPYAELWIGTHPSGPSQYYDDNMVLQPLEKLTTLPFILKILSVKKALSIQAHPNKELAQKLHLKDPSNYPDGNHKPEMALALTSFRALCGFRLTDDIKNLIKEYPEFIDLSPRAVEQFIIDSDIKSLFKEIISTSNSQVVSSIKNLKQRLLTNIVKSELDKLILELDSQYPLGEIGVFMPILLNYLILKEGESIFLAANEPHAYLSGDCIECMAISDNVVRMGLTPKFKDKDTLIEMLTYKSWKKDDIVFKPEMINPNMFLFSPPVDEFDIIKISNSENDDSIVRIDLLPSNEHSILMILECPKSFKLVAPNSEIIIKEGDIFVVAGNEKYYFEGIGKILAIHAKQPL